MLFLLEAGDGWPGDGESFASLCDGNMSYVNITYRAGGSVGAVFYGWAGGCESGEEGETVVA